MVSNDLIEIWWNVFILAHFISEFFFVLVEVPKESLDVSKCILTTYLIVREWFHTYLIIFSKIMITFKYCLICTKKEYLLKLFTYVYSKNACQILAWITDTVKLNRQGIFGAIVHKDSGECFAKMVFAYFCIENFFSSTHTILNNSVFYWKLSHSIIGFCNNHSYCHNNATCVTKNETSGCLCRPGFAGKTCSWGKLYIYRV